MQPSSFAIEEIAKYPAPGNIAPGSFAFSPDDRLLSYLYSPERTLARQLFAYDMASRTHRQFFSTDHTTTEENISPAEALRRERQRQLVTGVTHYEWASKGRRVLVTFPDGLYIQDGLDGSLQKILAVADKPALDARFSPDGQWVAFVQDSELYAVPSAGGEPHQLTHGARGAGKTNGLAEYVAQEEMGRFQGYWWSPDSKHLAFEEVDETHIPLYRIMHQGKHALGEAAQEDHHYPFSGQANAQVRLGVISLQGGEPVWMQTGQFEYLARVQWMPDGRLTAQLENRAQTELRLVAFDIQTGASQTLLVETNDTWINLHNLFTPLPNNQAHYPNGFIWASERSGFQHLYLYDQDGTLVRPLTSGDWMVDGIAGVDTKKEIVYFTGRMDSPLDLHLYAVHFSGDLPHRITQGIGLHIVVLDHGFKHFVDTHEFLTRPPNVTLRRLSDGKKAADIYKNDDPRLRDFGLHPPKIISLQNEAGITLYGALYRPFRKASRPLPTIVYVYGGPHAQMVNHGWLMTASLRVQFLRSQGYVVFVLDNRGSARRGQAFEGAIKHNLGDLEVQDQVAGVRWLVEQGIADPQRIGVYGWSYGGYMAAMCLCRAPETFKLAVAGAPVTCWDGYDTFYTERYMGTPQNNPHGYQVSSVMQHVDKMTGKLMLVHGLIDENVHFRHTARLINALIQACKAYSLLLFPDERHSPRRLADRVFMEEQIYNFIRQNL